MLSSTFAQKKLEQLFYYVDSDDCFESFSQHLEQVTIVAPQSYRIDAQGNISGRAPSRLVSMAKAHDIGVMPLVVNPGFDPAIIHAVLDDSVAAKNAIRQMVELCKENAFLGMQFDFEHVHVDYKENFTQFFEKTAATFHENGFLLTAAIFPRTSGQPGDDAYSKWLFESKTGFYDYKALSEAADFLSIMTYEQHYHTTPPGPVAGLPWVEKSIQYLLTQMPAEKVSLGIPFYSYHWFPSTEAHESRIGGRGMGFAQAMTILKENGAGLEWNGEQQVAFSAFEKDGVFQHLYIENAKSLRPKLNLIHKYGLRGFSVWRLGLEDPEVWNLLSDR